MKGSDLHILLQALTQAEKNQITRFFNKTASEEKKYVQLYRTLVETTLLDEDKLAIDLYGNGANRAARLASACDYLGQLVVEALAAKDPGLYQPLSLVRKAIQKQFFHLAYKLLVRALRQGFQEEEYELLLLLLQESLLLKKACGLDALAKSGIPGRRALFQVVDQLHQIEEALEYYQQHKWEGEQVALSLESMLSKLAASIPSDRLRFGRLQLEMRCAFLRADYHLACTLQGQIAHLVRESKALRLQEHRIPESGVYLRLLHVTNAYQEAALEALRLQAIPASNPLEDALKLRLRLSADFCTAMTLGRRQLGWEACALLATSHGDISPRKVGMLYFYAALFMSLEGRWDEVSRWCHLLLALPAKQRLPEAWPPFLLLGLAAIELDDPDAANVYLRRLLRHAKACSQAYPAIAARGLAKLVNMPFGESRLLLKQFRAEIDSLFLDKNELFQSNYFDLRLWIDARIQGRALSKVIEDLDYQPYKQVFGISS